MKTLINYLMLLLSQGLRIPLNIISMALLARLLGPSGMGKWAIMMSIGAFLYSVFFNWMQAGNIRYGCEEFKKKNSLNDTWSARMPVLLVGLLVSIIIIIYQPLTFLNRDINLSGTDGLIIFCYLISLWLAAEIQSIYQIIDKIKSMAIIQTVIPMVLLIYYLIYFISYKCDIINPVTLFKGFVIINLMIWGGVWLKQIKKIKLKINNTWKMENTLEIIRYSWWLIPTFLFTYFADWGDQLLLQYFFSSREVGLYQSAYQIMLSIIGLTYPLTTVLVPRIITLNVTDPDIDSKYINKVIPTVVALWIIVLIPLICVLPYVFILIMGSRFNEAVPLLMLLVLTFPGSVIASICSPLFSLHGRFGKVFIYNASTTTINLVISFLLLPKMGAMGAAIGTCFGYIIAQSAYLWDQQRYLKVFNWGIWLFYGLNLGFVLLEFMVLKYVWLRFCICIGSLLINIYLVRYFEMIDQGLLEGTFGKKLNKIGKILEYILIKP